MLPPIRDRGARTVSLHLEFDGPRPSILLVSGWRVLELRAGLGDLSDLARVGIRVVRLDTNLGYDEIVWSLVYVVDSLDGRPRTATAPPRPLRISTTHPGLEIHADPAAGRLEIAAADREASRAAGRRRDPRIDDPCAAGRTGRFAALAAFVISTLPLLVVDVHGLIGLWAWLAAATAVGAALGTSVWALLSARRTRAQRDRLLSDTMRQVDALSRFPEASPRPMWKISRSGRVLYRNPAARDIEHRLQRAGIGRQRLLPENLPALVARCLEEHTSIRADTTIGDRTFEHVLRRFPGEPTVLVIGHDVTDARRLERTLRRSNEALETSVLERTAELVSSQEALVLGLARLAELRDPDTALHLERTKRYVRVLATALRSHPLFAPELDDHTIEMLTRATPLHDIGKVGVPDAVLLKPGALTPDETATMRQHAEFGGDALAWAEHRSGPNRFLRLARDIAYYHHERWDGGGYPYGLTGSDIPLPARLMALADVYDALVSERVYKRAMGPIEARRLILAERGRQFDPDVVDAFLDNAGEFERIAREFAESTSWMRSTADAAWVERAAGRGLSRERPALPDGEDPGIAH